MFQCISHAKHQSPDEETPTLIQMHGSATFDFGTALVLRHVRRRPNAVDHDRSELP